MSCYETEADKNALFIVLICLAMMILCLIVVMAIGLFYLLAFLWENKGTVALAIAICIGAYYWWKNQRRIVGGIQ